MDLSLHLIKAKIFHFNSSFAHPIYLKKKRPDKGLFFFGFYIQDEFMFKITPLILSLFLASCTIYRSPERKEFESAAPQFHAQNLKQVGCSNSTQRSKATASRLITIFKTGSPAESHFLWEYIIDDQSYFESDNLHGLYCEFENK